MRGKTLVVHVSEYDLEEAMKFLDDHMILYQVLKLKSVYGKNKNGKPLNMSLHCDARFSDLDRIDLKEYFYVLNHGERA